MSGNGGNDGMSDPHWDHLADDAAVDCAATLIVKYANGQCTDYPGDVARGLAHRLRPIASALRAVASRPGGRAPSDVWDEVWAAFEELSGRIGCPECHEQYCARCEAPYQRMDKALRAASGGGTGEREAEQEARERVFQMMHKGLYSEPDRLAALDAYRDAVRRTALAPPEDANNG